MAVTQKQIAERLNISSSLVARALKGHTEVAAKTRQRVEEAAREMGYSADSNREARTLAALRYGQRVRKGIVAVGLLPAELSSPRYLPYYIPFFHALEVEAARHGFDVCLCPSRQDEIPRLIRERGVDGVISMGYIESQITEILNLDLPLLCVHQPRDRMHGIFADSVAGITQVTEHLLELGHRRIGFIGAPEGGGGSGRRGVFVDTMRAHGIEVPDEWAVSHLWMPTATSDAYCNGCGDTCAACAGWRTLLEQNGGIDDEGRAPFTAVICHNDPTAMGVIEHAARDGVNVPRDLSVTGFDDISAHYSFRPAITSVGFSRYDMGAQAFRLLLESIEKLEKGEIITDYRHYAIPTTLVVRDSTLSPSEMLSPVATGVEVDTEKSGLAEARII